MQERGYRNPHQAPRLVKIVINMGLSEAKENAKALDFATADLVAITGQKAVVTKAKKSIAAFKVRNRDAGRRQDDAPRRADVRVPGPARQRGPPAGARLPGRVPEVVRRARNYALGLKEQIIFPEIVYDKIDKVRGMDIIICTTAGTDEEAKALLTHLGVPFRE